MARVLIVDDNLMIRTLLREILTGAGHEIVGEAEDGVQAETAVRRLRPDLVTLDLVMPVRGGLDSLPFLLEIDSSLPIVVCSASLDQRRVLEALRHGATSFIVKPFNRESVLANVNEALALAADRGARADVAPPPSPAATSPWADLSDERREFVRVAAALPVRVTPPGGPPLITVTVDLSGSGLLLSSARLEVGTPLDFRLELGSGHPAVEGRGRVARVDGEGRPAVAFEQVAVADHERLIEYIHAQIAPDATADIAP